MSFLTLSLPFPFFSYGFCEIPLFLSPFTTLFFTPTLTPYVAMEEGFFILPLVISLFPPPLFFFFSLPGQTPLPLSPLSTLPCFWEVNSPSPPIFYLPNHTSGKSIARLVLFFFLSHFFPLEILLPLAVFCPIFFDLSDSTVLSSCRLLTTRPHTFPFNPGLPFLPP